MTQPVVSPPRTRIVIVGGGFAGFYAAKTLTKGRLGRAMHDRIEVVMLNPHDYFLYVPLLPQVMAGVVDPTEVTVPLSSSLPGVKLLTGTVDGVDLDRETVEYHDVDGVSRSIEYDQLLITSGSVNKLLPIPGVAEHALGFRDLAETMYLRDHVLRQLELADATDDADERTARLTFVVVGAGYTGTEVAAQGARMTRRLLRHHPRLAGAEAHWMLLDTADHVLPGLPEKMGRSARKTLVKLGVDVRLGTSVQEATDDGVILTDGSRFDTPSLIWCVGVRPDPLVTGLGLETHRGQLLVDATMNVPGHGHVWACGDSAAVPDVTRPGQYCGMTAQHAQRQGERVGKNIAARLGHGPVKEYRHKNLGFVVDLGGFSGTADPLGITLGGLPAAAVTRGYHLLAMPGNRIRTLVAWGEHLLLGPQEVQLGVVPRAAVPLETASPTSPPAPFPSASSRSATAAT